MKCIILLDFEICLYVSARGVVLSRSSSKSTELTSPSPQLTPRPKPKEKKMVKVTKNRFLPPVTNRSQEEGRMFLISSGLPYLLIAIEALTLFWRQITIVINLRLLMGFALQFIRFLRITKKHWSESSRIDTRDYCQPSGETARKPNKFINVKYLCRFKHSEPSSIL